MVQNIQEQPALVDAVPAPSKWADVSGEVLAVVQAAMAGQARDAADVYYDRLLSSVQDYLSENVRYNLASILASNRRELQRYRAERPRFIEALRTAQGALNSLHEERKTRALERVAKALDWADGRTTALSIDAMIAEVDESYDVPMGNGLRHFLRHALTVLFEDGGDKPSTTQTHGDPASELKTLTTETEGA